MHHTGLSDDTRTIVEWLTERNELKVLVGDHDDRPRRQLSCVGRGVPPAISIPMARRCLPEDFWNIAGGPAVSIRADLGIIALAAPDDARFETLDTYIERSVGELASTLVDMVQKVEDEGSLLQLEKLAWLPEWSSFLQYLAHTYRQIGQPRAVRRGSRTGSPGHARIPGPAQKSQGVGRPIGARRLQLCRAYRGEAAEAGGRDRVLVGDGQRNVGAPEGSERNERCVVTRSLRPSTTRPATDGRCAAPGSGAPNIARRGDGRHWSRRRHPLPYHLRLGAGPPPFRHGRRLLRRQVGSW